MQKGTKGFKNLASLAVVKSAQIENPVEPTEEDIRDAQEALDQMEEEAIARMEEQAVSEVTEEYLAELDATFAAADAEVKTIVEDESASLTDLLTSDNDMQYASHMETLASYEPNEDAFELIDSNIDASVDEILEADDSIDVDFMVEFLTASELDPARRDKLFDYITALDPNSLRALWESFKGTFGSGVKQIELNDILAKQVSNVDNSVSLKLRNEAVEKELRRFGALYAQLSRTFRADMSDTPLGAFRVDNITDYIKKLHHQLTTMNSAVLEMAEIIMVDEPSGDAADMAINLERVKRICALVGYGAKNWGRIHETAKNQAVAHNKEVEELKEKLRSANEVANTHHNAYLAEKAHRERLAIGSSLYIGNHSGNFLTTTNDPDTEYFRVSPFNLTITQDKAEALEFDDIEDARKVLDAVRVWAKRNIAVKNKFHAANINADTLFIFAETTVKVEG